MQEEKEQSNEVPVTKGFLSKLLISEESNIFKAFVAIEGMLSGISSFIYAWYAAFSDESLSEAVY
jgi:hypothetical protein